MKKKRTYLLEKSCSNKAFFMPCIMAYTLIFISFVMWQVTEVLDYQNLAISYNQFIQFESALYETSNYVNKINEMYFDSMCVSPAIPTDNIETNGYTVKIRTYCVREPGVTNLIVPGDSIIKPAFSKINNSPCEVSEEEYIDLLNNIQIIVETELFYEWIGLPIDAVPTKIDLVQYNSVLTMPCILFTDIKIETNEKAMYILVKFNCQTQKVEMVYHT